MQPAPAFGKRTPSRPAAPLEARHLAADHEAVLAAAHAEFGTRDLAVPRSLRAAILAGLVVGCCLAGLDTPRARETLGTLSGGLVSTSDAPRLVPVVILLGLYGGARAAATSLLFAHALLRRARATGYLAYAAAGCAVAVALSALTLALTQAGILDDGLLPSHGAAIDAAAGAGAGFFYRLFAGAAPVSKTT